MKTNRPTTTLPAQLSVPVDVLLADVAIRIQLNRSDYKKAVNRYQVISEWIERNGSPLENRVDLFYPQGSMATGSTIASKLRTDEFDIDIAAQIQFPRDVTAQCALDRLYAAIRGEPDSRYYGMTKRRTRCVTVSYRDNMHLDVTPMQRRSGTPERESRIFHHRAEALHEPGSWHVANPYGFAQWFQGKTSGVRRQLLWPLGDNYFGRFRSTWIEIDNSGVRGPWGGACAVQAGVGKREVSAEQPGMTRRRRPPDTGQPTEVHGSRRPRRGGRARRPRTAGRHAARV